MASNLKILALRTDNLGDLLLTLPALKFLRLNLPQAEIGVVIKAPFQNLLKTYLESLNIKMFTIEDPWDRETWSASLAFFCDFRTAVKLWRSAIPLRVGTYSKGWSFFVFNKGLRQKRSLSDKNEAVYSLELAQCLTHLLGAPGTLEVSPVTLPVDTEALQVAEQKLENLEIKKGQKFFVIHPGMAGSALNLSARYYLEIIEKLSSQGTVLISVGPGEQDQVLWTLLSAQRKDLKKLEGLELSALKEVFRKSRAVIAPSTGPLHLASAVGAPTIGLYSPIRSHHPTRWSPWGGQGTSKILFPQISCPADRACLGKKCKSYNCMEQMKWTSLILEAINALN